MSIKQDIQTPQEANSAYLKMRSEYRAKLADMVIEIKDEDYADKASGLLHGPRLVENNGLTPGILAWPNLPPPGASDRVTLYLDNGSGRWDKVAEHEFTIPAGGGPFPESFPYPMPINANYLPDDATCRLKYIITDYTDFETESSETQVICDRLPPLKHLPPNALKLAADYLDDDNLPVGGDLSVTIPGYPDWESSDKIAIYLVDAAEIPEDPTDATLVFLNNVPSPGITDTPVQIPAASIRNFGDAECVFLYVLIDKAQNPSAVSVHKTVGLTFGPLPANLHPPKVPQADPGPLVNEHVRAGVSVWLDKYDNWKAGDKVRVTWGATRVQPDLDFLNMPTVEVPVLPAELLLREYGENTTGIKSTAVSYQILRKGRPFGPQTKNFPVNFEVPIPWVPWPPIDWPDPVHPDLGEGEVKNHDETRTNELTRADKGENAKFIFTWYDTAQNDDVVDFFWNGVIVESAQVIFDDAIHTPGDDHEVVIPWNNIKAGGNNSTVPVHYQVHRPDVENDLCSSPTKVDVNAIAVELPAASFPKIPNPTGYPGCSALEADGALMVRMPDLTGLLKPGETISFEFIPMKGSDLAQPDDPIPGVKFEKDFVLGSADAPLTGFDFPVEPYSTYIQPLYDENPDRRGAPRFSISSMTVRRTSPPKH
ncbi:hypothetical protein [Pseudomonas frederiksbergensis]|uniref:Uncharacterized protein n=1 Tax=Pseudomonas frederiksbergensis TaxID=104087 RepID=A0A423HEY0_9PSED|nr:hypothetical protein [Pseudomonas frederiksbergensis]RON11637.1 hypothetical protein BK662_32070 [Pseudomonas frederiksbergensis]